MANANEAVELPLHGRIAAGTPIEALLDNSNTVSVPPGMIGNGEHYALEVAGDSMIDAGIMDGDTVLIQKCDTADNGAIVVALVDNNEVTLKRLRKRGDSIALEARQQGLRDPHLRPGPHQSSGQARRLDAALLKPAAQPPR